MSTAADTCRIESCLTRTLDSTALRATIERIRPLYLSFSPESDDAAIAGRLQRHPNSQLDLIVAEDGTVCAFSVHHTEEVRGRRVMFRGGTIVSGDSRSRGHYRRLIEHGIEREKPEVLIAYTQNPRVFETMRNLAGGDHYLYPAINGGEPPTYIRRLAIDYCPPKCLPTFDPFDLVLHDLYGDIRKDDAFKTCRDPAVRTMFRERLRENDGFLVVARL